MVESVKNQSRRGVQVLAVAAGILLVTAGILVPALDVGAQGLGVCPSDATIKVDPPVDGSYRGIGVDFSADGTDATITAPVSSNVKVYGFGGTSLTHILLGTVAAGTSRTFTDPLIGPPPNFPAQQFSHLCMGLTGATTTTAAGATTTTAAGGTTTTAAGATTTTAAGGTTTTAAGATTTTAAVLPTTIVNERVTTTTAGVLALVEEKDPEETEEPEEQVKGVVVEAPEAEPAQPSVERPRFTG